MKILLIEDHLNLASSIKRVLLQENFSVEHISNGAEAEIFWIANNENIDLVILDIQLPGKNGFKVCETIRKKGISTPVIMLTAKSEMNEKLAGFMAGTDDYLPKPFNFDELLMRIQALLRRSNVLIPQKIKITSVITFDQLARKIEKNGQEIRLTAKEFEILEFLVLNKNQAVSQQKIFDHCFDFAKENWSNTIEVHIKNIRKKCFVDEKEVLKTVRGFGYRLEI